MDAYARDPDSLFTCVCNQRIRPNVYDNPPFLPAPFGDDTLPIDQQAATCRTGTGNSLDCGTLSLATRHYPYTDAQLIEYNMHSLFAHMEAEATHNALASARDNKRPFILTRSSFGESTQSLSLLVMSKPFLTDCLIIVGTGKYAAKWLGDNNAEFDDMKMSIPGLLTASMFGFSMIGADICGFGAP